jgi:hypothetical protein
VFEFEGRTTARSLALSSQLSSLGPFWPIQRQFRIHVGDALDGTVYQNDISWMININEDGCGPCKIVRLVSDDDNVAAINVQWTSANQKAAFWVVRRNDFDATRICCGPALTSTIQMAAGEEVSLFVEGEDSVRVDQPFRITTSQSNARPESLTAASTPIVRGAATPQGLRQNAGRQSHQLMFSRR